jgi:pentatricopeptide repeat protein
MEYEGVELNAVSSTCLIQYFCTVGKFSECLKLMEYMMCNGPSPTTIAFNMLLDKLCKNGLLRSAHGIFEYLRNIGYVPDTTSYNILIRTFRREGNSMLVGQLFRDMYTRG